MKKIIQFFIPSFLKKLDQHLLENYPFLWSKRFAHVLFFGLLILSINVLVSSLYTISIFNYTPIWVFIWFFSVPAVFFILIWLFFQYKYDLAWDYARMKWTYYFGTWLSYITVAVICFLMVLLPAGIYQYRVTAFYNNSLSVDRNADDDTEKELAYKYLDNHIYPDDLSSTDPGSNEGQKAKELYVNHFIDNLDDLTPAHNFDTIIKPGIESLYKPDRVLLLSQSGDSTKKYPFDHHWIVRINPNRKGNSAYFEGTLNMFSPNLFFTKNKDLIYETFDSTSYTFELFKYDYLHTLQFPEVKEEKTFNWSRVLMDSNYYVESQNVKVYDKKEISKITDHRLNKTYLKYIFVTDLPEQGRQFEEYFIGVNLRGQNLLLYPSDFYVLKRFEYFLYKRFNIESLEHITPAFVNEHAEELQELGYLIMKIESDSGNYFVNYDPEKILIWIIVIYSCTAVLALILLTIRLLNFRILILSLLGLAVLSFIIFVPLAGFNVNPFDAVPIFCLSLLFGLFIYSVIRILYAKGTTLFMRIAALAGLVALPFIAGFYFGYYVHIYRYAYFYGEQNPMFLTGLIVTVIFLIGHIPLMTKIIHRLFYLPKR